MVARDFRFSILLFWWLQLNQFEHMVRWAKPLGRMKEEWLSPRSGELGWVCWRQADTAGQLWDFDWSVVSESVLTFVCYFRFISGVGKFSTVGRAFCTRCE